MATIFAIPAFQNLGNGDFDGVSQMFKSYKELVMAVTGKEPPEISEDSAAYKRMERDGRMLPKMKQIDSWETSTLICACGDSITWEGIDDRLFAFMNTHAPCCGEQAIAEGGQA